MPKSDSSSRGFETPGWQQKALRWVGLLAGALLALIITLSLLQCGLKKPEAPTWESTLRLPVASDHLDVANLLLRMEGGDRFVDEAGNVGLFFSDTLDTVTPGFDLSIPSMQATLPQDLRLVEVQGPHSDPARADLTEFYAGGAGVIPPFDIVDVDSIGPVADYTWIAPRSGDAWLKVENQLGLDFDSVTVTVVDLAGGPLGTFDFPGGIPAGARDSARIDIAGRLLYNHFEYSLFAHTPGGTLLSLANRYLEVNVGFSDALVVDSGLVAVPQIVRSENSSVPFAGSADLVAIRSALLGSGTLLLSFENRTPVTAGVTIDVPSLVQGVTPLSRSVALPPSRTVDVNVDLAGYRFVPDVPSPPQSFTVNVVAVTTPTGANHVIVRPTDSVIFSAGLSNLVGDRVTGVPAPRQVVLPSHQEQISVPSELSAFHAAEASLEIEVVNGSGVRAGLSFGLQADNGQHVTVTGTALEGSPSSPEVSVLSEPGLATLLDPYPTLIDIGGLASFGDSVTEYTLDTRDFALARVSVSAPLAVRIDSVTLVSDIESLEITGTDVDELVDVLEGGFLRLETANHLPVGVDLTLFVATDPARVFTAPDVRLGPIAVAAAPTGANGQVSDAVAGHSDLELSKDDLQLFRSPVLYFAYHIHLRGSAGQLVRVVAADYLDVLAFFDVTMRSGNGAW